MKYTIRNLVLASCLFGFSLLAQAEVVNINTADAKALATAIAGVGLAKAEEIVRYRELHGPFGSIDELTMVRGIGAKTVEKNRAALSTNPGEAE
jgi:competence protein ComEA